jgi:hypothetical protein
VRGCIVASSRHSQQAAVAVLFYYFDVRAAQKGAPCAIISPSKSHVGNIAAYIPHTRCQAPYKVTCIVPLKRILNFLAVYLILSLPRRISSLMPFSPIRRIFDAPAPLGAQ